MICATGLICLLGAAAGAAQPAMVDISPDSVSWAVMIEHRSAVLTVAGNGRWIRHQFAAGEPAVFTPRDAAGNPLPDGTYKWELTLGPASIQMQPGALPSGREDGLAAEPPGSATALGGPPEERVTSGTFTVLNGGFAEPSMIEATDLQATPATGETRIAGDLVARGTKNFAASDPRDDSREIVYAALEGPEAGTYLRGNAATVDGEAVIELPRHFAEVTEPQGLTVQLTPQGEWSQLFVAEMSPDRLVVRDAAGGGGIEFSFLIQGVRKGYADYRVERPAVNDR